MTGQEKHLLSRPGWSRWLVAALVVVYAGLGGCANFWDDVTSHDFKVKDLWTRPDPLQVLHDKKNGDARARALRQLDEPLTHGGDQKSQDAIMTILTGTAANDDQALCRMAAIDSLRRFKDPRAAKALEDAYYRAGSFPFPPETVTVIRCQALEGLGDTGNPDAIKTLVKVLREPPVAPNTASAERQRKLDERIAAARALARFPQAQATGALLEVLREHERTPNEVEDVALLRRAHESLQASTGQSLPPDARAWADYLDRARGPDGTVVRQPSLGDRVLQLTGLGGNQ